MVSTARCGRWIHRRWVCLSRVMQGAGSNGSKLHTCCWFFGNVLCNFMGMNFSWICVKILFSGIGMRGGVGLHV